MHEKFMRLAIAQAETAKDEGNYPFGAVVVKKGKVISSGHSLELSEDDVTRHAELIAVSQACNKLGTMNLEETTLYASGEPCNMCAAAILQAHIPIIVIGATRNDLAHFFRKRKVGLKQLAADSSRPVEIITGILKDEAIQLFENVKR
jgi:tRNA(Arg) A34 adenosine deaminase TadA